jgi:hypothetical protein
MYTESLVVPPSAMRVPPSGFHPRAGMYAGMYNVSLNDNSVLSRRGYEGSALAPPARAKSASPDLLSLRSLQTGRSPYRFFLLAPPNKVSPAGRGSCADSAQNPVTKPENYE